MLDGVDLTGMSSDRRARRGLARSFQRNSTFPDMTVAESLTVAVALARGLTWSMIRPVAGRRDVAASVHEIAATIGVADVLDVVVDELSYGTQRQLEIGLALASAPRLLMLDEPTAAMSPEETQRVQTLIACLPRQLTVVIIEHDMDVVFSIADRVTVLDRGEILAEGTPAEIKASNLVQARYLGGLPS